ncbi:MAG: sigma-54-dependent Fis family transcriptional regulator [Alphaproteobacteria bacterium]|nr:sigma-54-dependent Fis family transcriptional regulator [Alphaproteobacteria bacterium]
MSITAILLEDDNSLRQVLSRALANAGHEVRATASATAAMSWMKDGLGDVLIADVLLDGTNFLDQLSIVHRLRPQLPVIVMSAQTTAQTAIGAEKGGVFEYLPKPFDLDLLLDTVSKATRDRRLSRRKTRLDRTDGLAGQSAVMQASFKALARAAQSRAQVLIMGEAGTGKRMAAETLWHARGVETSALTIVTPSHQPADIFQSAQGDQPVLWLRIDEWESAQQRAALDAADTGRAMIVATMGMQEGLLDPRLAARLGECIVALPPLRARADDIPELAEAFLAEFAARDGRPASTLSSRALEMLSAWPWPGNTTELRAILSQLSVAHRGEEIDIEALDEALKRSQTTPSSSQAHSDILTDFVRDGLSQGQSRQALLDHLDKALIAQMLEMCGGNQSKTAERLGFNRNTLARRMVELGLKE